MWQVLRPKDSLSLIYIARKEYREKQITPSLTIKILLKHFGLPDEFLRDVEEYFVYLVGGKPLYIYCIRLWKLELCRIIPTGSIPADNIPIGNFVGVMMWYITWMKL